MKNEDNYVLCSECETNPCECKSWEVEFYEEFVCSFEGEPDRQAVDLWGKRDVDRLKAFIKKVIKEKKEENGHYKKKYMDLMCESDIAVE